jgi:hypothetical protein
MFFTGSSSLSVAEVTVEVAVLVNVEVAVVVAVVVGVVVAVVVSGCGGTQWPHDIGQSSCR